MKRKGKRRLYQLLLLLGTILVSLSMKIDNRDTSDRKLTFRDSIRQEVINLERQDVSKTADRLLAEKPVTVTSFRSNESSGGLHDFFSEGPYWWPDPVNPDGQYIRKDGLRNPGNFKEHDDALRRFSWIVGTETSAYLLTSKEQYAKSALDHLKAWLVDTATRMNPNMLYAQAIRGICTGRGIGIIDANPLMDVAQSVKILEKSPYASKQDIFQMKEWFRQFLHWLNTHPYGIDEMKAKNNHGSWWHAQVAVYASLVGDKEILVMCRDHFKSMLLPTQMADNGSLPLELERTKPYSYSLFNLDALAWLAWILPNTPDNLWQYSLPDGRGLMKGINFMIPFMKDKSKWPYPKDLSNWDEQPGPRNFLLFASLAMENPEWFSLWKSIFTKRNDKKGNEHAQQQNLILWLGFENPYHLKLP